MGAPESQELDQRLQAAISKLSTRTDDASARMLAQANALRAKLRSAPAMSDDEMNTIRAQIAQLEKSAG